MPLHPRAAAAVRTAALACAFAAAPGSARGDGDFQARAEEQYSHLDSAGSTSDLLGQRYLLGFGRQISPPIHYRLRLDYLENRDHVFTEGDRFLLRSLSPGLKLDYAIPDGSGQLRYDVRWLQQGSPAGTSESWLHQAVLSATARLSESSTLSGSGEWNGQRSLGVALDQYRGGLGLATRLGDVAINANTRTELYENGQSGYSRWLLAPSLGGTYAASLAGGAVTVSGSAVGNYGRTEERLRGGAPVTEPSELPAVSALYVQTSQPSDTTANPARPLASLADGDLATSTGIALGPDGSSFQNLEVDMGRVATLARVRVYVRDASGNPLQSGGPISWSAYSSNDGSRWLLLPTATAAFDPLLSAWEIGFPATGARFFKVVNFGVNDLPTYVTELKVFELRTFAPRTSRVSEQASELGSLGLSVTPVQKLSFTLSGYAGATQDWPYQGRTTTSMTSSQSVGASAGPFADLTWGGNYSLQKTSQSGVPAATYHSAGTSLSYAPSAAFNAILGGGWALQEYSTLSVTTLSGSLSSSFRPLETLGFNAFAGVGRSRSRDLSQTVVSAGASADAKLRRDLDVNLSAAVQRSVAGQPVVPEGVPIPRPLLVSTYTAMARYHPSSQLDVEARFGYTEAEKASGLVQNYRILWNPFPGGALTFSVGFQQDVEPATGSRQSRLTLMPRWTVSRNVALSATYFRQWGSGILSLPLETYFITLTLQL